MKKILKKYDNICVFILLFSLMLIPSFMKDLYVDDELWNFTNVYKMYNGYTIYRDCNVIITPLFYYLGRLFFEILGANYFVFRLYSVFINAFLFLSIYQLFKVLNISKNRSLLYTMLVLICTRSIVFYGANYSNLALLFVIAGIILLLKNKNILYQGIIFFLVFMCKQNIGVYYVIGSVVCQIFINNDLKKTIKNICIELGILIICFGIYVIYLYKIGNLQYFIDLVFLRYI